MCGKIRLLAACSLIALTTASCATQNDKNAHGIPQEENGALETYNRGMFKFNYQVDKYVLKPVAKGYRAANGSTTPSPTLRSRFPLSTTFCRVNSGKAA